MSDRIASAKLRDKVMSAEEAVQFVNHGDKVGTSGFTGAGYPKAMPAAIAEKAKAAHEKGQDFSIDMYTGASTAPECDGVLAEAGALRYRMPYQSDPTMRNKINAGEMKFQDIHLSHSGMMVEQGFFGEVDLVIVEAVRITEDGNIVPSSSVGNSVEFLNAAKKIIIEVNSWQSEELEGMHDIWTVPPLPNRIPIPITKCGDRIGTTYIEIDPEKVVAVIETNAPDRNAPFKAPDEISEQIAGNFLDFLENEVKAGRLAYDGYVMQSGVGNVPNAVMAGLMDSKFENIQAIILRPQSISNHPEVIRRTGLIASNGMIEADIYGNANSTHINGSRLMNALGGSGDFTRNAYISSFISPSVAKDGAISAIVPFASHIDHNEHDAMVFITEYGVADLRGLAPRDRVAKMISIAHPSYRPLLEEYVELASKCKYQATPHDLRHAFDFHLRMEETGTMMKQD